MSSWDNYQSRIEARGITKRQTTYNRETQALLNKVPESLSYHTADVYPREKGYDISRFDGENLSRNLAIINSDNLDEKTVCTLPGEDIENGSLVHWMDCYWLVTERDYNTTIYTKAKMIQCNHLLRWIAPDDKQIHEQWVVVEDGTKYLTGEFENAKFIVSRGDSRIAMTLARNALTVKLNRKNRFLVDDPDAPLKMAYALTKPLKIGSTYNNQGVFKFVMSEVNSTDEDNQELGIADYYKYYPHSPDSGDGTSHDDTPGGDTPGDGRESWL